MPPNLPARKAGGKRVAPTNPNNNKTLPILHAQEIILEDGTKVIEEGCLGQFGFFRREVISVKRTHLDVGA